MRCIYTSKIVQTLQQRDVEHIIQKARKYNERDDITGLLISNFEYFFQVIEGPEKNISALYEKIKLDPRHTDMHLITKEASDTRLFPDWKMGYLIFPIENPPIINAQWTKMTREECDKIFERVVPGGYE